MFHLIYSEEIIEAVFSNFVMVVLFLYFLFLVFCFTSFSSMFVCLLSNSIQVQTTLIHCIKIESKISLWNIFVLKMLLKVTMQFAMTFVIYGFISSAATSKYFSRKLQNDKERWYCKKCIKI